MTAYILYQHNINLLLETPTSGLILGFGKGERRSERDMRIQSIVIDV